MLLIVSNRIPSSNLFKHLVPVVAEVDIIYESTAFLPRWKYNQNVSLNYDEIITFGWQMQDDHVFYLA